MILSQLPLQLAEKKLVSIAPKAEIHKPLKKDYWPEQWKQMKHFTGAHVYEAIHGKELFYQVGFMHGKMKSVQINTTSEFHEAGYMTLVKISNEILSANVQRCIDLNGPVSMALPWEQIKDFRLSESGLPNDRYLSCFSAKWQADKVFSCLNVGIEWPQVLSLEYREDTRDS